MHLNDSQLDARFDADRLMGVYMLPGVVDTPDAAAAKVRELVLDPTRIPDLTVLAESPAEAEQKLEQDEELALAFGVLDVEPVHALILGGGRVVLLRFEDGDSYAYLDAVSDLAKTDLLAMLPSPFTGARGSLQPATA